MGPKMETTLLRWIATTKIGGRSVLEHFWMRCRENWVLWTYPTSNYGIRHANTSQTNHGQVTLIDHDPVKLLLCYEPPSILDKIFRGRGLGADQYQGGLSTLTRMLLKMVNPHLPHTPEHVSME